MLIFSIGPEENHETGISSNPLGRRLSLVDAFDVELLATAITKVGVQIL